jgi:hypothetical protein
VIAQRGDRRLTAAETALRALFRSYVAPNARKDKG